MITGDKAFQSYEFGWANGEARRKNTRPTISAPASIDSFFYDIGERDGYAAKGKRNFLGGTQGASTDEERLSYDDGYYGNSAPRFDGYQAWFAQGRADRAAGLERAWVVRSGTNAPSPYSPGPVRPAPPYVPNPNAGPGPVVIVNPPPPNGGNPNGFPPPVVVQPAPGPFRGGYRPAPPPWYRQRRRTGIVIRGPWGEIDLAELSRAIQGSSPSYY